MLFDSLFWTLCIYGWLATFIFFGLIYVLGQVGARMDKGCEMKTYTLIILDDGETYSGLHGASIITISEDEHQKLEEGTPIDEIKVISEISLRDLS